MMHSFKPTLFTFIPIILIFGWLNANMGYFPITEGAEFPITAEFEDGSSGTIEMIDIPNGITLLNDAQQKILTNKAEWVLKGEADGYSITYEYNDRKFNHSLIIAENEDDRRFAKPVLSAKELGADSSLDKLIIGNEKVRPLKKIPLIGSIPWIGNFGWLGTYILFSLIFSIGMRKILKVY